MGLRNITYEHLQDCEYRQKYLTKQQFYAKIKVPIVQIFYMAYPNLYYA